MSSPLPHQRWDDIGWRILSARLTNARVRCICTALAVAKLRKGQSAFITHTYVSMPLQVTQQFFCAPADMRGADTGLCQPSLGSRAPAGKALSPSVSPPTTAHAWRLAAHQAGVHDPRFRTLQPSSMPVLQLPCGARGPKLLSGLQGNTQFLQKRECCAGALEGRFIATLARLNNAKTVLEVGMFTGTTTLAVAQALPDDGMVGAQSLCFNASTPLLAGSTCIAGICDMHQRRHTHQLLLLQSQMVRGVAHKGDPAMRPSCLPSGAAPLCHRSPDANGLAAQVVACEIEPFMRDFAQPYFERASVSNKVMQPRASLC